MQTDLNNGDILFMTAEYKQTENPDEIAYISLPKDEFDWHAFTNNNGNIKVKAGSSTAGYYYAYAYAPGFSTGGGVGVPAEDLQR